MSRVVVPIGLLMAATAGSATARDALGVYGSWGAFTDAAPARCFAIARPVQSSGGSSFASIATWPGRGARNQLHIRLSRERDPRAHVTLSVGDRRFELAAGAADAWAPDARTDAAIVTAMRNGRSMSVETVDKGEQPFADVYTLHGAATAIDAAAIACIGR